MPIDAVQNYLDFGVKRGMTLQEGVAHIPEQDDPPRLYSSACLNLPVLLHFWRNNTALADREMFKRQIF
jgi:hypothetical protein